MSGILYGGGAIPLCLCQSDIKIKRQRRLNPCLSIYCSVQFVAPKKKGYLFIDNPDGVSHLSFRINGSDHEIKLKRRMKIDISRLIKDSNIVSFWALDSSEKDKKVKVWIEIFEAEDE